MCNSGYKHAFKFIRTCFYLPDVCSYCYKVPIDYLVVCVFLETQSRKFLRNSSQIRTIYCFVEDFYKQLCKIWTQIVSFCRLVGHSKGHCVIKEYSWWELLRPQDQDEIFSFASNAIEHYTSWNKNVERDLQTKFKLTISSD